MTQCHAEFIKTVAESDAVMVFVCPDIFWADGCGPRLFEVFAREKKRMLVIFTPRLTKETLIPELLTQYCENNKLRPIGRRALGALGMKHLHEDVRSRIWNTAGGEGSTDSGLFWQATNGILARQFHLFPLAVRPLNRAAVPARSVDADYGLKACPDLADIYVAQDSDDICLMDITSGAEARCERPAAPGIKELAKWAMLHTDSLNRHFVRQSIRFHSDECTYEWRELENESDLVVNSLLALLAGPVPVNMNQPLAKSRYLSPSFLANKLRKEGVMGFGRQSYHTLVNGVLRKILGPDLQISEVIEVKCDQSE